MVFYPRSLTFWSRNHGYQKQLKNIPGVFFKTPRKNIADFRNHGLLFTHYITWVKKVRGVFKINVILNSNSEISFESPYLETLERYKWSIISQRHSDNFPTLNN